MNGLDITALWLTVKLAAVSTLILLVLGVPLAWWLARSRSSWRTAVEAIIALPLVLPPTVVGFYLLVAFAPASPAGRAWHWLTGQPLAFTFAALVFGSVLYSVPFVVQQIGRAHV